MPLPERRRNWLTRKSVPVFTLGAASAVGLVAYLAKPVDITVGDIDWTGIFVVGPTIYQMVPGAGGDVPPTVDFWSDWRTATGVSDNAVGDGGKWNGGITNNFDNATVITPVSTCAGWPTDNALRNRINNSTSAGHPRVDNAADSLLPGESRFYRWHSCVDYTTTGPFQGIHSTQPGPSGSQGPWEFDQVMDSTGARKTKWHMYFEHQGPASALRTYDLVTQDGFALPRDTTVRVELEYFRGADAKADSSQLHARVYVWNGSAFALRYDDDDFVVRNNESVTMLDSLYFSMRDLTYIRDLQMGVNGWDNNPGGVTDVLLFGAMAICDDWCGSYPISGVEN